MTKYIVERKYQEKDIVGRIGMKVNSIFGQNITKARFQWKTRIFCFIFELDFINYLFTFGGIHEHFWQRKVEKHRWYL